MQPCQYFLPEKVVNPSADEAVDTYMYASLASGFEAVLPPSVRQIPTFERTKVQPSVDCPKNFIIFDQTAQQSRIMFHPGMTYKLNSLGFIVHASTQDNEKKELNKMERELSSPFKEDYDDIDALLSLEGDELEDLDEEEVSTARTDEIYESISDTCSRYYSKSSKKRSSSSVQESSGIQGQGYWNNKTKHREMKKMVRMMRRIVPGGGNQMDTVTVLDEAVKYLKSLKAEVEQLGVGP
ncbi:hypothetical protein TanjilG_24339 [Lupinus angustifolius]|uniref:BHLH domain-containing protein n=1 Tax=Lupinus angustifolius TaxID=3871 RepID=A0A1J7J294_LUPAN|nr:PREDICTED: transcription factor bHLH144 [Lupinus angustifolius]XP_019443942.1 PREDICTED: transcription factor bHLH144 [Lupinus angustifolius]OIW19300.1 hypothetical protein TanjilG_24339 [Lupinus angustifolius]